MSQSSEIRKLWDEINRLKKILRDRGILYEQEEQEVKGPNFWPQARMISDGE